MHLTWLQPAVAAEGPFTTAHLDVTRQAATSDHDIELRWQSLRRRLEQDGAPADVLDAMQAVAVNPTGLPGERGRSIVAGPGGVLLDRVVPRSPVRPSCHHGVLAHLMPLVRALDGCVSYVVVEVDRSGASVSIADPLAQTAEEHDVEGGHDVLHQVPGGGMSHRRFRSRVHDSWERNATVVAEDLDKVFARHRPRVVVLTGDPKASAALTERLGQAVKERLVEVEGGGRQEGTDQALFAKRVEDVLNRFRQTHMGEVMARYEEAVGKDHLAAAGLPDVVAALRGGAVETLLLHDDPSSPLTLWAGADPLHLGLSAEDVQALGATTVVEDRADAVLLRALVAQGGTIELVDTPDVLRGGIGALLRFDVRPPVPGGRG